MSHRLQTKTATAFAGSRRIASRPLPDVAAVVKRFTDGTATVLVFDDETSRLVEFDLRGTAEGVAARIDPEDHESKAGPGLRHLGPAHDGRLHADAFQRRLQRAQPWIKGLWIPGRRNCGLLG